MLQQEIFWGSMRKALALALLALAGGVAVVSTINARPTLAGFSGQGC